MATYKDMAPLVHKTGITKSEVENYFKNLPSAPALQPEPTITKSKVVALANVYFQLNGISKAGGIKQVSSDIGLTPNQVKSLIKEIKVLKSAYDIANQPN